MSSKVRSFAAKTFQFGSIVLLSVHMESLNQVMMIENFGYIKVKRFFNVQQNFIKMSFC